MIKILTDSFIELINTGRYTEEQLKEYLKLILSKEVNLEELYEKIFKTFYK